MELSTRYLGLSLKNPLIVGASPLTADVSHLLSCETHGAGAVVLRSLFQEEIAEGVEHLKSLSEGFHTEAADYLTHFGTQQALEGYLSLVREAKERLSIPVIASLNCSSREWWAEAASRIEEAGADALELNVAPFPSSDAESSQEVEERIYDILKTARSAVSIPISMKVGPYFTSLGHLLARIEALGAGGVVLFNRFYQVDIDPSARRLVSGHRLSDPHEFSHTLRWTALEAPRRNLDIVASCGIHSGLDIAKAVLAGASAVQVVSAVLRHGFGHIEKMLQELEAWLSEQGFSSLGEAKGALIRTPVEDEERLSRLQYLIALRGFGR